MLQPLGHRVLIKPDVQPETSAGGLILPEDRDHVPVSGQVVALGPGGSLMKFKARERALSAAAKAIRAAYAETSEDDSPVLMTDHETVNAPGLWAAYEIVECMRNLFDPERDIKVGDFVVFPAEVGFHVNHEGEAYILVNEDDIAVLETA